MKWLLIFLACLSTMQLFALPKGKIISSVKDEYCAPLENVAVSVLGYKNTEYIVVAHGYTNRKGICKFKNINAGKYNVIIGNQNSGYKTYIQQGAIVSPNKLTHVSCVLENSQIGKADTIKTEYRPPLISLTPQAKAEGLIGKFTDFNEAEITILKPGTNEVVYNTKISNSGWFDVDVPKGIYDVSILCLRCKGSVAKTYKSVRIEPGKFIRHFPCK